MNDYLIAGIKVNVIWDLEEEKNKIYSCHDCIILPRIMEAFSLRRDFNVETVGLMTVRVHKLSALNFRCQGRRFEDQRYYEEQDKKVLTIFSMLQEKQPGYSMIMSKDYSEVDYIPHIQEYNHYDLQWIKYAFECRMITSGGFILHGAAIEYRGQGVIFSGISGSGKSTQAHLWQHYRQALILNGDCPAIRLQDGVHRVYGTPWNGTSGEAINRNVPLKAIVMVKQGKENKIRKLDKNQAVKAILSNILRSNFDMSLLDTCIAYAQQLIEQVNVYELVCTIDEEAVEVAERIIFEKEMSKWVK